MAEIVAGIAERDPDGPALTDERGTTSWSALNDRVNRLIAVLRGAGLQQGDRVALLSGNRREIFEASLACVHSGLFVVPMNWNFTVDEAAYVLQDCGAPVLIADDHYIETAAGAAERVPGIRLKLMLGDDAAPEGFESYEQALAAAAPDEPEGQITGSPMSYTSGTTGRPKGVMSALFASGQPLPSLVGQAGALVDGLGFPRGGTSLLVGPYYHSGQWAMSTFPLLCGSHTVAMRFPDVEQVMDTIDREQVTNTVLLPPDFVRMLKLPQERRDAFDGSSLVRAVHTGAPCPPDVKRRMLDWWGERITEVYGATEAGPMCVVTSEEWVARPGTVGRVMPHLEWHILTDDGEPAEARQEGLIYFRHRSGADFVYHNQPEKTAEAHLQPGLFTLGDVGYADEDGYVYLSDRRSEAINSGGVKVYPAEIEAVLADHPAVEDVAVFGVPNDELGEEVKAVVQPVAGHETGAELEQQLIAFAAERMAPYKIPRSVDFMAELPRTDAGKLAKKELRAPYWEGAGRRI